MPNLNEMLGGTPYFARVVEGLRRRVLDDPDLGPHFSQDRPRKWEMLVPFLAALCGDPNPYQGNRLRWIHLKHEVRGDQFRRFLVHLSNAMLELGTTPNLITRTMVLLAPLRDEIASAPTRASQFDFPVVEVAEPPVAPAPLRAEGFDPHSALTVPLRRPQRP